MKQTINLFAKLVSVLMVAMFVACSGMDDRIEEVAPQAKNNITMGKMVMQVAEDAHLMIETDAAQLGQFTVTNKGSFAQTGNVLTAQVKGNDGQVTTITVQVPAGFTANAELKVTSKPAALPTKGAYAIAKTFTTTVTYSGIDANGDVVKGVETLETPLSHVQYDPSQNLKVEKELQIITETDTMYLPSDTVYVPGPEVIRTDTVERLVKVTPRQYVKQTASNEKEIIEMSNPGSFSVNGTPKFENGVMQWTGSDGQNSTAKLSFADDTEVSDVQSKVTSNVVKLHAQVYRIDQTITTNAHYSCSDGESGDTTLVSKVSHYQVDPTVPTETLTEYVTVYVDVPGPTDTVYVDKEVIVEITKTETKEVYIYIPGKELFVYVDNGVANVKLDDETALEANVTLKKKVTDVEKSNLGIVELISQSALGAKQKTFQYDADQEGTVNFSANGCTVKSVEYDHFESKELRKDSLHIVKLYFKVTFQYQDVKVEDNEVKNTVKENYFFLSKPFVQKAQEEIVPVTYEPTLDWNISATATEVSLKCKVGVKSSDDSFNKVFSWTAALAGLESYTSDLYLDGTTAEVTDGNFCGVLTDEVTEKDSKDGVWHSVKRNLSTKDASKWMLDNGTLVGPNNNINYYFTSLTCHLPNGEDIKWEVVPETVVDNHKFSNNGVQSFTLSDGRTATYWQTLNTGVHHYITIKVTYNGETETLSIPCLESKGNGKFLLCENTCSVNIFTTK